MGKILDTSQVKIVLWCLGNHIPQNKRLLTIFRDKTANRQNLKQTTLVWLAYTAPNNFYL